MAENRKQRKTERVAAFEAIVAEYQTALLRYASRLIYDHHVAQDIVQNTFLRMFKSWKDELEPSPRLSSWLYRVAHNCAIDYIRKDSRRRLLHTQHSEEKDTVVMPDRGKSFKISDEANKAVAALQTLSSREQQLVILKVYEEKSYKEISEIAELSVSNVGYILHHAMKKLAEELKKAKAI
jgi:RNA polymerase sigma factor (sigma-70 family)